MVTVDQSIRPTSRKVHIIYGTDIEFIYIPNEGSRLNMAEIDLNVLIGQCLNRRIDTIEKVKSQK